jgi:uncharacterized protein (DUF58 family)
MLLGAMNYGLSMGFLFTFLLTGVVLATLFATWRNLLGITVLDIDAQPAFLGEQVGFTLHLHLPDPLAARAAGLYLESAGVQAPVQVEDSGAAHAVLALPTYRRGYRRLGPCRLCTEAPLGLFRAWCVFAPAAAALVWPRPGQAARPLPTGDGQQEEAAPGRQRGSEDFDGLSPYHPGESPARLVWKSRGPLPQPWLKTFVAPQSQVVWLDWAQWPGWETEARLSQLCRGVLQAERLGLRFGLRLPGLRIPPGRGPAQRLRCLHALAVYGLPGETPHAA